MITIAYLDGLPPSLRFGDLRHAKVNALRELQSASGKKPFSHKDSSTIEA